MDQDEPKTVALVSDSSHSGEMSSSLSSSTTCSSKILSDDNDNVSYVDLQFRTIAQQRRAVRQAMDLIPYPEKQAYLEAVETARHVVNVESDPAAFLRIESYCAEAAAQRLAKHWSHRRKLLENGAFRSLLDLTDNGALPPEDREILKAGSYLTLLKDSKGRPIFFIDIDENQLTIPYALYKRIRPRLVFYMIVKFAVENPLAATDGFRMIRVLRTTAFDLPQFRLLQQLIDTSTHIKIFDFTFIGMPPVGAKKHFRRVMLPLIESVEFAFGHSKIIMGDDRSKMLRCLLELDFCTEQLPPVLGGTWSYDAVGVWFTANQQYYKTLAAARVLQQPENSALGGGAAPATLVVQKKRKQRRHDDPAVILPAEAILIHAVHHKDRRRVNHTYHDYSQVPPDPNYTGEPDDITQMSFVQKVHHLLSLRKCSSARHFIYWLPHGRAFQVNQLEESEVWFQYFGIRRVAIFLLLLRSHGFKVLTTGPDRGAYYHECMLRNLPHLTQYMPAPRDIRILKPDPENEPCFYTISETFPLPTTCSDFSWNHYDL